jgi:hypothetical protein
VFAINVGVENTQDVLKVFLVRNDERLSDEISLWEEANFMMGISKSSTFQQGNNKRQILNKI